MDTDPDMHGSTEIELPDGVTWLEPEPGFPVIGVSHAKGTARIALHGAHVTSWVPAAHAEVFYVSPKAALRPGKAIRGGVPVCWPWFGAHPEDGSKPAHGFARNRFWRLVSATANEEGVELRLELPLEPGDGPLKLAQTIKVGGTLDLALETTNASEAPHALSQALHSYFAVGDIEAVRVEGLDGCDYLETLAEPPSVERQSGAVRFSGETDRIYATGGRIRMVDERLGRVTTITSEGSNSTVVWNPWIDKAARLGDLPDEDYRKFVCLETANAWRDARMLAPGEKQVLKARISSNGF